MTSFLGQAAHNTKRQVEELVAELFPKADVPSTMRKLPQPRWKTKPTRSDEQVPEPVAALSSESGRKDLENEASGAAPPAPVPAKPAEVKPLTPERYKITFTASAELRDKLERLRALMRSSVPDGNLAAIIEKAVTEKLERLESKRFGKTKAPRKSLEETDTSPSSRHIPAAVKRAVCERDQHQRYSFCRYG